ncbi:hypothetical protein [Mesobacterium pallidum]|uniref:hypothetical protein n=1 Tax=Mesobacterium pallidum TaxID=2872037 RepID=UPI001EE21B75|nr:hypothetical protein [Mesobacterium pallidum]
MTRAALPIGLLLGSALTLSLLLQLGEQGWRQCLGQASEVSRLMADTALTPVSSLMAAGLLLGPFAGFALFLALARNPRQRKVLLAGAALFGLFCAWALLPPASQHDCDRKGTHGAFVLPVLIVAGWIAALFTNKITCLWGACAHDPTP